MHAWFAVFSTIHSRILLTECASESLYSVQNIAIHRIRVIFDSSNTLVYRLGPSDCRHVYIQLPVLRISSSLRSCSSSCFPFVGMRLVSCHSAVRLILLFFHYSCCWPILFTFLPPLPFLDLSSNQCCFK